jgi:hypothetical protein
MNDWFAMSIPIILGCGYLTTGILSIWSLRKSAPEFLGCIGCCGPFILAIGLVSWQAYNSAQFYAYFQYFFGYFEKMFFPVQAIDVDTTLFWTWISLAWGSIVEIFSVGSKSDEEDNTFVISIFHFIFYGFWSVYFSIVLAKNVSNASQLIIACDYICFIANAVIGGIFLLRNNSDEKYCRKRHYKWKCHFKGLIAMSVFTIVITSLSSGSRTVFEFLAYDVNWMDLVPILIWSVITSGILAGTYGTINGIRRVGDWIRESLENRARKTRSTTNLNPIPKTSEVGAPALTRVSIQSPATMITSHQEAKEYTRCDQCPEWEWEYTNVYGIGEGHCSRGSRDGCDTPCGGHGDTGR